MSKIKGDINREMMKNSHVRMVNAPALELIAGVLEKHTDGVLAGIREKMDQMKEREKKNKDTLLAMQEKLDKYIEIHDAVVTDSELAYERIKELEEELARVKENLRIECEIAVLDQ